MTCDRSGRLVCRLCARPVSTAYRADGGRAYALVCDHCGTVEKVTREELRTGQPAGHRLAA